MSLKRLEPLLAAFSKNFAYAGDSEALVFIDGESLRRVNEVAMMVSALVRCFSFNCNPWRHAINPAIAAAALLMGADSVLAQNWLGGSSANRDGVFDVATNWSSDPLVPGPNQVVNFQTQPSFADTTYAVTFNTDRTSGGVEAVGNNVTFSSGATRTYGVAYIDLLSGATLNVGSGSSSFSISIDRNLNAISSKRGLLQVNAGTTLNISGTGSIANTTTGTSTILNGTFTNAGSATFGTVSATGTISNTGTATMGAVTSSNTFTNSGTMTLSSLVHSVGTFTNSGTATMGAVTASGTFNSSGTTTFSGLTLSGTSTVSGGFFGRTTSGAGTPALTFSGTAGSLTATGGTINLGSIGVSGSGNGDIVLQGVGSNWNVNGNVNLGSGGTWQQSSGSVDVNGSFTATSTSVSGGGLYVDSMTSNLTQSGGQVGIDGAMTGNAGITGGIFSVNGNLTGDVSVAGASTTASVAGNIVGRASVESGGTLNVTGGVTGNLTVATNGTANIAGTIGGNASVNSGGSLNVNSVTGNLSVSGGSAVVNTVGSAGGSHILSGGTLNASTVNGDLAQSGGTISPGNSPGITSIAGNVTLSGGTLDLELRSGPHVGTAGTDWDLVDISGALSGSGNGTYTLKITSLMPTNADGALTGWNPNLKWEWTFLRAQGGIVAFDAGTYKLGDVQLAFDTNDFKAYNAGVVDSLWYVRQDGNNLVLGYNSGAAAVPEPSSFAVLGILGAAGLGVRRWRRRKGQAAEGEVAAEVAQAE